MLHAHCNFDVASSPYTTIEAQVVLVSLSDRDTARLATPPSNGTTVIAHSRSRFAPVPDITTHTILNATTDSLATVSQDTSNSRVSSPQDDDL